MKRIVATLAVLTSTVMAFAQTVEYDILIRNGQLCDGSGNEPRTADLAIRGDKIVEVGTIADVRAKLVVDAAGLVVAPGFINVLSWATETLLVDGRSQSDIRQGVTLEIFGEGESMGPLNASMKEEMLARQGDLRFEVPWTTLGDYLDHLVKQGVSPNVASFVGATTVRIHELGYADRAPAKEELARMCDLVSRAMNEGALGLGASLIYAPAFYAKTDELIALARAAGQGGGIYIAHLRSEGARLLEALDELITIAEQARVPAQVYHFKAAGRENWPKADQAIARIEEARARGLKITADMYPYPAGATGLDAAMPPWVQEGGYDAWAARLKDPMVRARLKVEMSQPTDQWENFFLAAGSPENILLAGFKNDRLKPYTGKSLAEVARMRGTSPQEAAMDLVIEDGSRVGAVYFLMSEENVRKNLRLPWVSFDSDAASLAPEGAFLKSQPHPRAYGTFARVLGRYVREEKLIPLAEAIRRMTSFPAETLSLDKRGRLRPDYFADVVVFDPEKIRDNATFDKPHQYATGVHHVFVNGVQVLKDGEHTGAKPGQVVRGPGFKRQNR